MRGLGKILFGFSIVTGALLLYVHERVEILQVSYALYEKSSELSQKAEEFRRLNFEVARLRSPQSLEARLKQMSLSFTLPKEIRLLRIPESDVTRPLEALPLPPPSPNFFDFFGQWIQIAQARTEQ